MATYVEELIVMHCAECGIPFGITSDYQQRRKTDGEAFNCPVGHSNVYKDTEIDRLKKQLQFEKEAKERAYFRETEALKILSATKGVLTRVKHRIQNGVCPCCNRTFQNLARHMKTKHPADAGK